MTEEKGVGRRRKRRRIAYILDDLRNRRRYWELKKKLKIEKDGNDSLPIEHKDEIKAILHESLGLIIRSIL